MIFLSNDRMTVRWLTASLCTSLLILNGCALTPPPQLSRGAQTPTASPGRDAAGQSQGDQPDADSTPLIRRGSGIVVDQTVATAAPPSLRHSSTGSATFNFEGESLQAVIKAILGDLLGQNYVIAPGVQGTVTLATPRPVSPSQAMSLLEMVLGWNNARMVYSDGRYNIVPSDQALAGNLSPSMTPPAAAHGYEVRVVALRYISASEMKKVLEPYARPNAIVAVDSARNVITIGGTRSELDNYLRTVQIFDVDWLAGMSVGVFPIQSGKADKVAADLEKIFGDSSKTPSAGMFRFLPLDNANAILVITPQARYLDQIQSWLDRIDSVANGTRLFSYELKYIKAKDLADRLSEVFGGSSTADSSASVAPGLQAGTMNSDGLANDSDGSSDSLSGSSSSSGGLSSLGRGMHLSPKSAGNGGVTLDVKGDKVGISAVEETNTLLVHASSQAWHSIRDVVEKLDVMPMQVHIEAQVAEVSLTGQLQYGVNWFFENAVDSPADANNIGIGGGINLPNPSTRHGWRDFAGKISRTEGLGWTFLGKNAASVITALDSVTHLKLLQAPSVFVRNNSEAVLNVGTRIPINSSSVNAGNAISTYSTVQYLDTGVILRVRPRVTKDGMVFLDLVQEVSTPGARPSACTSNATALVNVSACNVDINTRRIKTEAAVQNGDTILLAGLINDSTSQGTSGVPGLSRLPIIGALFGSKNQEKTRSEVIVLLTPTIVRNVQESRNLTDEYSKRFEAMKPMKPLESIR